MNYTTELWISTSHQSLSAPPSVPDINFLLTALVPEAHSKVKFLFPTQTPQHITL